MVSYICLLVAKIVRVVITLSCILVAVIGKLYQYYLDNIAGQPEIDQVNFTNHSFVLYLKSALTFFYINEIIKDTSEGTKKP